MTLARNLADLGNQVDSSGTLGIGGGGTSGTTRSEEHTSELQSH